MTDENFSRLLPIDEIASFRNAVASQVPRCVRFRPDRMDSVASSLALEAVPWFDRGRLVRDSNVRPSQSLRYAAADYYIQDAGSLLALALLDAQPHEVICDLCAAPGGKASGIGESLGDQGFLLANEPIGSRTAILRYALARTGNPRHAVTQQDPEKMVDRFSGLFDAVLVDAPCSGQAMVARGKRDVNAFDRKQVEHSASRQRRILLAACRLLKTGGRLIYSTCTFAVEENESQIQFLRNRFPDCFEPIQSPALARWASPIEPGCFRLWPHRDPTSGAFSAGLKLCRPLFSDEGKMKKGRLHATLRSIRPSSNDRHRLDGCQVLSEFGTLDRLQICNSEQGDAHAIPDDTSQEIVRRLDAREWPKLATCRNGIWKPEFLLAMLGPCWFQPHENLDLSADQARKFMLGEALILRNSKSSPSELNEAVLPQASKVPWFVARWRQKPLGWCKIAGNRANNHLPTHSVVAIGNSGEFIV